jgi:hypothetical protein
MKVLALSRVALFSCVEIPVVVFWINVPPELTAHVEPLRVSVPEFRTVPSMLRSVPVPFARVSVLLLAIVSCPPLSTMI